jgi:hypothetical protein
MMTERVEMTESYFSIKHNDLPIESLNVLFS